MKKICFFGYLAPVVLRTRNKLKELVGHSNEFVGYVASSFLVGLEQRFGFVFELSGEAARNELLAAMTLPQIKLNWVPEHKKEDLKNLLINEAMKIELHSDTSDLNLVPEAMNHDDDDLFDFEPKEVLDNVKGAELECIRYLTDPSKRLESLNDFKRIKVIFLQYNTALPSSAPADRLFSYGKMVLRPQRARLSDEYFEYFVFLKLNAPEKKEELPK